MVLNIVVFWFNRSDRFPVFQRIGLGACNFDELEARYWYISHHEHDTWQRAWNNLADMAFLRPSKQLLGPPSTGHMDKK